METIDGDKVTIDGDTYDILTLDEENFIFERSEEYKNMWTVHYECQKVK